MKTTERGRNRKMGDKSRWYNGSSDEVSTFEVISLGDALVYECIFFLWFELYFCQFAIKNCKLGKSS